MKKYIIKMKINYPSKINTDFNLLKDDIMEAIKAYNDKFSNRILIPSHIKKDNFVLFIKISDDQEVTSKIIASFSRYLYYEKEWAKFSRKKNFLFKVVEFHETDEKLDEFPNLNDVRYNKNFMNEISDKNMENDDIIENKKPQLCYKLIQNPLITILGFFVTIITWIGFFRSSDPLIKALTLCATLSLFFIFYRSIKAWFHHKIKLLTKNFFAGIIIGIIIGSILMPLLFQPAAVTVLTLVSPNIEFVDSLPNNGEVLYSADSGISIRFDKPIPTPFYKFIKAEIYPNIPIEISWTQDHQIMFINSTKIFPGTNARFDYDTNYQLKIQGPSLSKPVIINFHSPKEKTN